MEVVLNIPAHSVQRWYPRGYGEAFLYDLKVTAHPSERSENTSKVTKKIGFRTAELIQTPLPDQEGTSFYFKVNDIPIFAKGTNWIPADVFESRVTEESIRQVFFLENIFPSVY